MTPTSEERREVAERLRDYAQLRNCYPFEAFYVRLNIALFGDNGWDRTDGDVFERLADLIDPTCTVVSESVHTGGFGCEEAGYEFTLSCGHTVIVDGEFPPSYCDECGARVVDDGLD